MHLYKIIPLLLITSFTLAGKVIEVPANESHTLTGFKKDKTGAFSVELDQLTLKNNSYLIIPNNLSGEKVLLKVQDFKVKGHAHIIQAYTNDRNFIKFDYLSFEQYIQNLNGRAPKGTGGPVIYPARAGDGDGDNGIHGNPGKVGPKGRDTVSKLTLDVNITHFDQLDIILAAESGGNGGNGSAGQGGSDAKCDRDNKGANGGNGGRGGPGGMPGNVGDITFKWQSDYPIITTGDMPLGLNIKQIPGAAGMPGDGGNAGNGGAGIECRVFGRRVYSHGTGHNGQPGDFGPSVRGDGVYFFLGNVGNIKVINKDRE